MRVIVLTDHKRANCLTCAKGNQTKNRQSQKDTGAYSPIDRVGGFICSDLKRPMTPRDRLNNRCIVNFADHKAILPCLFSKDQKIGSQADQAFPDALREEVRLPHPRHAYEFGC